MISRKERRDVLTHLFKEGVMVRENKKNVKLLTKKWKKAWNSSDFDDSDEIFIKIRLFFHFWNFIFFHKIGKFAGCREGPFQEGPWWAQAHLEPQGSKN